MKKFLMGFFYAGRGVVETLKERNMKVHVLIALVVVALSIYFKISAGEWIAVVLSISIVFGAEAFNTAIETISNVERDSLGAPYKVSGKARDIGAAAVLFVSIGAALVGGIIFIPKMLSLL